MSTPIGDDNPCSSSSIENIGTGPKFSDSVEIRRFPEAGSKMPDSWTCAKCTLSNDCSQIFCAACNQKRLKSPDKQIPQAVVKHVAGLSNKNLLPRNFTSQRQTSESMDLVRLVEESEAAEQFTQIVAFCKVNNQSFIDDSFPPNDSSIGNFQLYTQGHTVGGDYQDFCERHIFPVTWRRPFQIVDDCSTNHQLSNSVYWSVYSNPKSTDIIQGYLGNCWFLSALAVLAERRELLEHAIITKILNLEGVYQIRLCIDGRWRVVLVDDYFPCDKYYKLIFSHAKRRQLWVPLIEKALAKLHGSYAALSTGRTVEGLAVLTGAPCVTISLEFDEQFSEQKPDLDLLWAKLLSAKEAGFVMGTSCGAGSLPVDDQKLAEMGLHPKHAYSLLNVRGLQGLRLVQLRNPWGHSEWNGAWSNGSELWSSPEVKNAFCDPRPVTNDKNSSGGLFWMPFEEFCRYFDSVDVCKLRQDCKEIRVEIPLSPDCSDKNVFCVYFHVDETTEVDLALYQSGMRNEKENKQGLLDLCLLLFHSDIYGNMGRIVKASDRLVRPFVVLNCVLSPGTYLAMCLSFVHWHTASGAQVIPQAVLAAHSSCQLGAQLSSVASHFLADGLIEFLLNNGQPYTELDDVMIYYSSSKKWSGLAIMVENTSATLSIIVTCNCVESENVVSSRASLHTCDVILPRRRQLLILLTQLEPSARYSVRHSVSYVRSVEPFLGRHAPVKVPQYSAHYPPLDATVRGLHEGRPI